MKEAKGDSLDKALARLREPEYLESRAINQLKTLQQPITVNAGSYAYRANIKKNPYFWQASDGSPIKIKSLKEIGEYFDKWVQEEWDDFLDDGQDIDDLVRQGIVRQGAGGAYRDQEDYEHKQMLGDAIGEDTNEETPMTEDADMTRLLKLAGMYHKPQVFETEENKEGDQSPLSDVTDFVADVRGEKPKDPEKFVNADGDKSVLSEKDVEEGWDPFQDELDDEDYYDDQSQEDFPGRSRRFANPGSALYAADSRNPRIHPCPTCGGENRLTQRDLDAGYQCDRCADAAEGIGLGSYGESIEETEVEEDYLEPPHQKDPHTNEEDDWYDPEDARRQVARMGAHPEFTGRHELKPHDPIRDQEQEDEWVMNQAAEQDQMAAMDDWDVFNKQGVDEEGDLGNGYGSNHAVDGEDFFPSGATSNVVRKVGPSGARHGDNPMSKVMATESKKLHEKYLRDFADFKKKTEVNEARPPAVQAPRSGMSVGREVYDLLWKNKMFVFDRDDLADLRDNYDIDMEFGRQDFDKLKQMYGDDVSDDELNNPSFEQWLYNYHRDIRVSGAAGGAKYINVQLLNLASNLKDWKKAKELIERNIGPVLQMGTGGDKDAIRIRFDRSVLNV
jgi:hypothetical protein